MAQINTRKRNGKWEYRFEIAGMDGKRKQKSKGGYRTKAEALKAGTQALNLYNNAGVTNESKKRLRCPSETAWRPGMNPT